MLNLVVLGQMEMMKKNGGMLMAFIEFTNLRHLKRWIGGNYGGAWNSYRSDWEL